MAQPDPVVRSISAMPSDDHGAPPEESVAAGDLSRSISTPNHSSNEEHTTNGGHTRMGSGSSGSTGSGDMTPEITFRNKKGINGLNGEDHCDCKPGFDIRGRKGTEADLVRRRSASILEVKEQVHHRLKEELLRAQSELKLKDEECQKLSRIQDQLNNEVEELTAKLFEEANNMVQDAHIKRMQAEKLLKESNSKIEVLQAEVTALKTLVITSTPSMPNAHLHPQIEPPKPEKKSIFKKGHRRATSHHIFKEMHPIAIELAPDADSGGPDREVDPVCFEHFKTWRASKPTRVRRDAPFLQHIIQEDVLPCLSFTNQEMSSAVFESVLHNTLVIEPMPEKNPFPRKCALTETTRLCKFRIRVGDSEEWQVISNIVRNRIASVCDFITYIRYITLGLVKSDDNDIYWEIIRLRKLMNLARLGLS